MLFECVESNCWMIDMMYWISVEQSVLLISFLVTWATIFCVCTMFVVFLSVCTLKTVVN